MLLVDPRAGSGSFLEPLKKRLNDQAQHFTLDSGDFAFSGWGPDGEVTVGVELKEVEEFLASARSGRYLEQLRRMSGEYEFVYLLIYGVAKPDDNGMLTKPVKVRGKTEWIPLASAARGQKHSRRAVYPASELHKFIFSLELRKNVNVLRASSAVEVTWYLTNLYTYWQKPWEEHKSVEGIKVQVGSVLAKASVARRVAAALPGIGWELAGRAERYFGSVVAMSNASIEEWEELSWDVKGGRKSRLGRKKAEVIWKAMRSGDA